MKILKNFDAKKIAKAKNKILLAIVSILFLAFLFLSSAFREFVSKYPGLIGVLIAVSGEVYFDWKEESGRHSKWKKFFMALLVVSLAYELYEASESDQKAADSIKLAGQANDRAANTESNNLVLRSNVMALELKLQQRTITPENREKFIKFLINKPRGMIRVSASEGSGYEVETYAERIRKMCGAAGYDVGKKTTIYIGGQIPAGIGIGVANITNQPPFAGAVQKALKEIGINSIGYITKDTEIRTNGIVIYVGAKTE